MASTRQNILVIQADQLAAPLLRSYGGKAKTPHLDSLAGSGTVFKNFYCNYPLCGPSRGSMLTGKIASRVGVYDNAAELPASEPTFAHFLRYSGYRTCLSGKMHFIGPDQLHGFEERLTTDIYPADFAWLPDWETGQKGFEPMRNTIENAGVCAWNMQIAFDEDATQRAIHKLYDFSRNPDDSPFFLFVSLSHPHHPFLTLPEFWEMYSDDEIPVPIVGRLPSEELDPHSLRCRQMIGLDHEDVSEKQAVDARHAYYGSISYFDAKLGQILDALDMAGFGDSTAIFVTADHGEMLGERGLWAKDCFFESAMKVPLVVKLPDQKAPVEVLENCSLVDLLPTFLDVANIDFSNFRRDLNGQSLMGLLTKNEENWGDEVLAEYTADATMEPVVMIRNRQYKYIAAQNDPELLFDLKSDANELSNLAHEKRFESVIETFRRRVSEVWDLDDLGRRVRISQKNRMIVRDAMKEGQLVNWDFSPTTDYSDLYVRSSNSHEVVDRKVRIKAKGYQLPISSTAK